MESTANIILTVLYVITMLVSLIGNTVLIYIVWKKPEVRSLTSFMFVNMAVADLLVTSVVIPYTISNFYTKGLWPLTGHIGEITCKLVIFVAFFTINTSILCLTFIAVDRYYAVVHPFRRLLWFRRPKVLTPLVWVMSMTLMSIVPVYIGLFSENSKVTCGADYTRLGDYWIAFRVVYIYFFVINYLFPTSIISSLYIGTARKLWLHRAPGDVLSQNRQHQEQITKRRVVRMLIIVFTSFAFCWLPGQVFQLLLASTKWAQNFPTVMAVCLWCGYNNSAINPWLYIGMTTNMRKAFYKMIGRGENISVGNHNFENENEARPTRRRHETQDARLY